MKKFASITAGLAVIPMLAFAAPVFADSPGSLAGGSDIYQVRNVTQNGNYGSSASAACDETVKYSVKLSDTDYGQLTNVTVKASLTTGSMAATATTSAGGTTSTSGTVKVTVPGNGSLSYVAGSTNLYAGSGSLITSLADGVTANGVNAGTLAGSTTEFLQFQAKVDCNVTPPKTPVYACTAFDVTTSDNRTATVSKYGYQAENGATFNNVVVDWGDSSAALTSTSPVGQSHTYAKDGTYNIVATSHFTVDGKDVTAGGCAKAVTFVAPPAPGQIQVCDLSTKKIVNINENDFDSAKYTKDLTKCQATPPVTPPTTPPTALVNTGPGQVIGLFAAVATVGAVAHRLFLSRRLARR